MHTEANVWLPSVIESLKYAGEYKKDIFGQFDVT